jgi:hypothetical protein
MSVAKTKLNKLRERVIEECFNALEGELILVEGVPLIVDGKPLRTRPTASTLNVIRQLLKDNGIDREAVEAPAKVITDALPFEDPETPQIQHLRNVKLLGTGQITEDTGPFSE